MTEGHHQEWSLRLNLTQRAEAYQGKTLGGLTGYWSFHNYVAGGAWPFLVGGLICLVNSVNERDHILSNNSLAMFVKLFLGGLLHYKRRENVAITGL